MASVSEDGVVLSSFEVDLLSTDIDPGTELVLRVSASCRPRLDLRGYPIEVRDHIGEVVATASFSEYDGEISLAEKVSVSAPATPGTYTWQVVLPSGGDAAEDAEAEDEAGPAASFDFVVNGHRTWPVVWSVPAATEAGATFRIKAGARASAGIPLSGTNLEVYDHTGARVAEQATGDEPWPGTTALYWTEFTLTAPAEEGRHRWEVRVPPLATEPPHGEGRAAFVVRSAPRPQFAVQVEAVDQETQAPVAGARIVMRPYDAIADDRGVAELRVAPGDYRVFAKARGYLTAGTRLSVQADGRARLELVRDAVDEHAWWVGV